MTGDQAPPLAEADGTGARPLRRFARRLPPYLLVVLVLITLNFALPRLMPGDPVVLLLGDDAALIGAEARAAAEARLGLDGPVWAQYLDYLGDLARGDLGDSFRWRRPVSSLLMDRLPWTLLLVGTAILLSSAIGIVGGTLAAWRRGRRTDTASLASFLTLDALPAFWIGLLMLILFTVTLGWLPGFGARTIGADRAGFSGLGDVARHLVLPALTLTLASLGGMFLITRYALLGVVRADFVVVARAKGLSETRIAARHAIPAASLPIVTVLLLRMGFLVGGAVIVETLFTYPGLGRLILQAATSRDYPVMQGAFLVLALTVVAANLVADLLYPLLDPRVSGREGGRR